ncbi:TetR/AcrR family transcriptional regulator [Lentibacillus sediminis]|uniref:TetR/AcrR family transcriptional regulator n=1 Tax=Lentibacillus sediminis TaxID=1940529 RepID=UPI000C1BC02F|nr:TetR/AcrR family transcriptional regulator [Lentibacillus sediminis]
MDGFERRREQKKSNILEAALALFMKYGIQKVSVAEIAKEANVSQVTIYNYYGSKDHLIDQVIIFYIDNVWEEYEHLLKSNIPFPDKIKQVIFEKTDAANEISGDFFNHFMKEYTGGNTYLEKLYAEKVIPEMINLFDEGKEQGYINPSISNEAILFYIQMFTEYMKRDDVAKAVLPMTEELTKLFFYGIVGKTE